MIVFSDMDGTLLTSDKQMSDATWAMLDELARRGIEFVPCTGRPLSGIFEPILAHPAVHYAVCANGASVWQLDDGTAMGSTRWAWPVAWLGSTTTGRWVSPLSTGTTDRSRVLRV